jgi:hypothetical protein
MMSGLYTALHGENPFAGELLGMIGIEKSSFLRYRDAYAKDGAIIVYTRNGGGNRTGTIGEFMKLIKKYPSYLSDKDDDFDSTYAYITFSVDPEHLERLSEIEKEQGPVLTVAEKFKKLEEPGAMDRMIAEGHPGVTETINMLKSLFEGKMPTTIVETDNFRAVGFKKVDNNE